MPRRLAKLFVLSLAAAACGDGGASTGAGGAAASSSGFFPGNSANSFMCAEGGAPSTDASVASSSDGSSIASTSATGGGGGGANPDCVGVAPVSYANDVVPVLAGCTGEQCHAVPTRAVLVEQPSTECCGERLLVKPGDPRDSYLLDKLEGVNLCTGGRMPLGGLALPADEQLTLRAWICEGAPAN